ncbi:MAG: hypothetical protein H6999_06385 [Hahellaceae bacterium]|nr:hypothetical protein [Hahellaceae bacterium]MCP5169369.1 hypothetical protein [Hahellaceae bacterium]
MKTFLSASTYALCSALLFSISLSSAAQAQERLKIEKVTDDEFAGRWQAEAEELTFNSHATSQWQTEMTLSINGQQFAANFNAAEGKLEFPQGRYRFSAHQQELLFDAQAALSAYLKKERTEFDSHVVVLVGTLNHFAL